MKKILLIINTVLFVLIIQTTVYSQPVKIDNTGELKLALEKLNVLGSVLYIAAHPDDENTSLMAYFSKGRKYRAGYLSLTRGSGGQNLIGLEKGVEIGILRTQELLQARNIDGGEQYFSRAMDFGYSKSVDETFQFWGKEDVLKDVVWVIRKFRPDIIITRFLGDGSGGHGNHTASALLAQEAFKEAADPTKFPEQLKYVQTWQTKRIFWNSWRPSDSEKNNLLKVDVGDYNPLLAKSYTELAALSRSMHKSQGFGISGSRGSRYEYFQFINGEPASNDILDGVNTTWDRVKGGKEIGVQINEIIKSFNDDKPAASVKALLQVYEAMNKIKNNYWVDVKKKELLNIIQSCCGLWMEAIADDYSAAPGDNVQIKSTIVNRSDQNIKLEKIEFPTIHSDKIVNSSLKDNDPVSIESSIQIPNTYLISQPYWLVQEPSKGLFNVEDQQLIGLAENPPSMPVKFYFDLEGRKLEFEVPLQYRWNDHVDGEKYRPFEIRPPVAANVINKVMIFPDNNPKEIQIKLMSNSPDVNGKVSIQGIDGWRVEPGEISFSLKDKYDEKTISFKITPPENQSELSAKVVLNVGGKEYSKGFVDISYPHIKHQVYFPESEVKLVRLDIKKFAENIGYLMGSGDEVPNCLRDMGYKVTMLDNNSLQSSNLSKFDVIIAGIRAYNTDEQIKYYQANLMDYIKNGGTYIVQYSRPNDLQVNEIGPYPISLSRDRISNEDVKINLIDPNQQVLNFPNKITEEDFDGWVQERGLYFANNWDEKYQPIFSGHDPGESDLKGGTLFTHYGKGIFIYTAFAWFRQLPAGVPGAYRIFANLISAGKYNEHPAN